MPDAQDDREEARRPTVADVDPSVLAVHSLPDEVRMHTDPDETELVQSNSGDVLPTSGEDGDRVENPND